MTTWRITIHGAESDWGRLGHAWNPSGGTTACGIQCAYSDGTEWKTMTSWISAGMGVLSCPKCYPRGL